jgi:hypothetical protein
LGEGTGEGAANASELHSYFLASPYQTKTIAFAADGAAVTDTVLTRYLVATADSVSESRVLLQALVRDRAGNTASVMVRIGIGGPRAQILAPAAGQQFRAGTQLQLTGMAVDRVSQVRTLIVRISGAVRDSVVYRLPAPRDSLLHAFDIPLPSSAVGELRLTLVAENRSGIRAASREVTVRIDPPIADVTPPTVRFEVESPRRAEMQDSIDVVVRATDDTRLDSVGVFIRPRANGVERPAVLKRVSAAAGANRIRVGMDQFDPVLNTVLSLEVIAFAVDSARNCGYAVVEGQPSSTRCTTDAAGNRTFAERGAQVNVLAVSGRTVSAWNPGDRIANLISDGTWVFLSNFSQNRVERLRVAGAGANQFSAPLRVWSEPWGLALDKRRDSLYVANSGGTNISVVPLHGAAAFQEARRIQTADIRLYDIDYDVLTDTVAGFKDLDFSDRPQFLALTDSGRVIYSTRPTATKVDGTVRIRHPRLYDAVAFNRGSEIFVGYGFRRRGKVTLVNAIDMELRPGGRIWVQPRPLNHAAALPDTVVGTVAEVRSMLHTMLASGITDTRLDDVDATSIGLSDTTFVAVSGDH